MAYPNSNIKKSTIVSDTYLEILVSSLKIIPGVTRNIDSDVDITKGKKFGQTAYKKRPAKAITNDGRTYVAQPYIEDDVPISFNKQLHTGPEFDVDELAMEVADLQAALEPFAKQHGSDLESWFAANFIGINGDVLVGSGTSNEILWKDFLRAGSALTLNAAGEGTRSLIIDPATKITAMDNMLSNRTEDASSLSEIFKKGTLAMAAGFDIRESTRLPLITTPADIVGTLGANYVEGDEYLVVTGMTDGQVFQAGTPVTVAGVNRLLPDTRKDTGKLAQFVVALNATVGAVGPDGAGTQPAVSGTVYFKLSKVEYYTATDARRSISAQPTAAAAVTLPTGLAASTTYRQAIAYDSRAAGFYSATLKGLPALKSQNTSIEGISVLYTAGGNVSDMDAIYRFDTLTAGAVFYPEWIIRIWEPNV